MLIVGALVLIALLLTSCAGAPQPIDVRFAEDIQLIEKVSETGDEALVEVPVGALRNAVLVDSAYRSLLELHNTEAKVANDVVYEYNGYVKDYPKIAVTWAALGFLLGFSSYATITLIY